MTSASVRFSLAPPTFSEPLVSYNALGRRVPAYYNACPDCCAPAGQPCRRPNCAQSAPTPGQVAQTINAALNPFSALRLMVEGMPETGCVLVTDTEERMQTAAELVRELRGKEIAGTVCILIAPTTQFETEQLTILALSCPHLPVLHDPRMPAYRQPVREDEVPAAAPEPATAPAPVDDPEAAAERERLRAAKVEKREGKARRRRGHLSTLVQEVRDLPRSGSVIMVQSPAFAEHLIRTVQAERADLAGSASGPTVVIVVGDVAQEPACLAALPPACKGLPVASLSAVRLARYRKASADWAAICEEADRAEHAVNVARTDLGKAEAHLATMRAAAERAGEVCTELERKAIARVTEGAATVNAVRAEVGLAPLSKMPVWQPPTISPWSHIEPGSVFHVENLAEAHRLRSDVRKSHGQDAVDAMALLWSAPKPAWNVRRPLPGWSSRDINVSVSISDEDPSIEARMGKHKVRIAYRHVPADRGLPHQLRWERPGCCTMIRGFATMSEALDGMGDFARDALRQCEEASR